MTGDPDLKARNSSGAGVSINDQLADKIKAELRRESLSAKSTAARLHGGGGFRARRSQKVYRYFLMASFIFIVVIPTIYMAAYLWAMRPVYTTVSRLSVISQSQPAGGLLSSLTGQESSGESHLTSYLDSNNIIQSLMLNKPELILESGIFEENAVAATVLSRVSSMERKLELWRQRVRVDSRSFTSIIEVAVSAHTPQSSYELHREIIDLAESHINLVSDRTRSTQLKESEVALDKAKDMLSQSIGKLQRVREKYNLIDPEFEAIQRVGLIFELEQEQADLRQRLDVLNQRTSNNPQADELLSYLEAIERQKMSIRETIAGNKVATIAQAAAEIAPYEAEIDAARAEVGRKLIQLAEARDAANRQGIFLQEIVSPVLPETAYETPRVLYSLIAFFAALVLWLCVAAGAALVRDHAR